MKWALENHGLFAQQGKLELGWVVYLPIIPTYPPYPAGVTFPNPKSSRDFPHCMPLKDRSVSVLFLRWNPDCNIPTHLQLKQKMLKTILTYSPSLQRTSTYSMLVQPSKSVLYSIKGS